MLTAQRVIQSKDFGVSFALKFISLWNNWKAVTIAQSSGRVVYQAPEVASHVSVAFLCPPLQQCRHNLLCQREFRSTKKAQKNTDLNHVWQVSVLLRQCLSPLHPLQIRYLSEAILNPFPVYLGWAPAYISKCNTSVCRWAFPGCYRLCLISL